MRLAQALQTRPSNEGWKPRVTIVREQENETMKRYNLSTRVLGAFAALTLAPAAFAQTAQDPIPNDPANDPTSDPSMMSQDRVPSGDSYGQRPQNERRVPEMTDTRAQKAPTTQAGQTATQPTIDPAEVQQVFGQQASLIDIKSLSTDEAKNLQQRLKDLGYYKGAVDGQAGPQTKAALNSLVRSQFVLTQRLVEQGQIPSQLATTVGLRSDIVPTSGSINGPDTGMPQPRTLPQTGAPQTGGMQPAQPRVNPPASYDAPPANYNDSPRSPSGNNAPSQQQTVPKR
jgi:putative peptidoglycan binding protein